MIYEKINKMIELSMEKKKNLLEILDLTKRQETIIENDKMDDLDNVLKEKEKLMEKIDNLDIQFLSLYKQIKEEEKVDSFDKLSLEKYKNIIDLRNVINEINNILNTLSMIDKNNIAKMKFNLEKTQSELKQVKL